MTDKQINILKDFLKTSHSDDDLYDFIQEHKLNAKEVYLLLAEIRAPDYCKGCIYILSHGFYPCIVCSRGKEDKYCARESGEQ